MSKKTLWVIPATIIVVLFVALLAAGPAYAGNGNGDPCKNEGAAAHNPHCNTEDTESEEIAEEQETINEGHGDPPGHNKVTICHKPGTPAQQTKQVPEPAVDGHLGHGDYLGPCQEEPPTETPTPSPSPTPSPTPTETPTETPSPTPTETPTEEPTEEPTEVVTEEEYVEVVEVTEDVCAVDCCCTQVVTIEGDNYSQITLICGDNNHVQLDMSEDTLTTLTTLLEAQINDLKAEIENNSSSELTIISAQLETLEQQVNNLKLLQPMLEAQAEEVESRADLMRSLTDLLPWILALLFLLVLGLLALGAYSIYRRPRVIENHILAVPMSDDLSEDDTEEEQPDEGEPEKKAEDE